MKSRFKVLAVVAAVSSLLGGCAVYSPPPAYYASAPVYVQPGYVQPAPVYVQPAPVYAAPPVSFGLSFGWWGGHHGHH